MKILIVAALTAAAVLLPDPELKALYESGQTYQEFLEDAEARKADWVRNTEIAWVPADLLERARAVEGSWHLLAVLVDGCSDSAANIPYIAALADSLDHVNLRLIKPDTGRFLMSKHPSPDGRASTPTVVLLDADFEDVGAWIERPAPLQEWAIPARDSLSEAEFVRQKTAWYEEDGGVTTLEEVVTLLEGASR